MSWMRVLKSKQSGNWFGVFKGVGEKRREQQRKYYQRYEQREITAGRGKLHKFVEMLDDRLTNRSKYNSEPVSRIRIKNFTDSIYDTKHLLILDDISQIDNPQYIIDEAKKLDINLHDPFILRIFLTKMKERGWDMKEFENIKGLLPQEAAGGDSSVDLTPKIKEAVKMFKHMNKPITQESILDELELDERMWKDEYDELLE
jgi:hypothetical protein